MLCVSLSRRLDRTSSDAAVFASDRVGVVEAFCTSIDCKLAK